MRPSRPTPPVRPRRSSPAASADGLLAAVEPRIKACARRFFKDPADVEEVAADVLSNVALRLADFDGHVPPSRWVGVLARNHCLDVLRRRGRRPERLGLAVDEDGAEVEVVDRRAPSPFEEAARGETAELVRRAVAALSPVLRATVLLRFFEGHDQEETARRLRISVGTVKSRTHRAQKALGLRLAARVGLPGAPGAPASAWSRYAAG